MARSESKKKMLEWQRIKRLGRRRIAKAAKDSATRSLLFYEALLPTSALGAPSLNYSDTDTDKIKEKALIPVPSFLSSSSSSSSSEHQESNENDHSFLTFPPEVRNLIYQYAVEYPTCRELFDSYYKQKEGGTTRTGHYMRIKLHTPTVLLLCKQVTREALTILRSQPFVIDKIPPWIPGCRQPLPITEFISAPTLRNILYFEFKVTFGDGTGGSGYIWRRVLRYVLDAWSQGNSVTHLRVMFKLANIEVEPMWYWELKDYEELVDNVSSFAPYEITYAEANTVWYQINNFEFRHAAKPGTVQYEHWIIDCFYAYRTGFRSKSLAKNTLPNPCGRPFKLLRRYRPFDPHAPEQRYLARERDGIRLTKIAILRIAPTLGTVELCFNT